MNKAWYMQGWFSYSYPKHINRVSVQKWPYLLSETTSGLPNKVYLKTLVTGLQINYTLIDLFYTNVMRHDCPLCKAQWLLFLLQIEVRLDIA